MEADLEKKFVFLSGPRQVGKTTLARAIIAARGGVYLSYDDDDDRRAILEKAYVTRNWVGLDEFYKFPRWKAHVKGVFDKHHPALRLLLTGRGRLDVFQKSGDSLFGRYHLHHLHPFTVGELCGAPLPPPPADPLEVHASLAHLPELMRFGGFPGPFSAQSDAEHRRWSNLRRQLLIREDMREMSRVEMLALVEQLMLLLPERVGSLFSVNAAAEDIRVSPATVKNWLEIFERLFITFALRPFTGRLARALHKQPKVYFTDWSQVPDEGDRFENLVAAHLLKAAQTWTDLGLANVGLRFTRDRDGREVDFLLTREGKPWFLVEAKAGETRPTPPLQFFARRLNVPAVQLLLRPNVVRREGLCLSVSADRWLGHLPWAPDQNGPASGQNRRLVP